MSWLQRHFEVFVIAFGIGIGLYFSLPQEPGLILIGSLLVFASALVMVARHRAWNSVLLAGLFLIIIMGVGRSAWHSSVTERVRLPDYERVYEVTGHIAAIEKSGPRLRWRVAVHSIDRLKAAQLPEFIRVTTFDRSFKVGDGVVFHANLSAPPGPVIPDGYDPGFRAYFQKVGGYGYMLSKPVAANIRPESFKAKISHTVSRFRYRLAARILERAPPETAGLQTALLTGIRSWVPDDQTDSLRAAGLAHILAISGLHMGLVAGSIYALVLMAFVRLSKWARRYDMRKPAAFIGILTATAYLVLSGASVATQRAYIMAVIIFAALIFDRQAISIRSVAVAAFITLWLHPEVLVSPGFQMSFSAVLALVVVYREWDKRRVFRRRGNWIGRAFDNFKALSVTSLVAGTATSGFAVLHFNRIATYGFFGNLLAMPIFTFWVMPAALVVYAAMPFGLEALPLWIMGQGIKLILVASDWVYSLSGSVKYMASGSGWVMAVFGLAFIGLCLGSKRVRLISVAALSVSIISLFGRPQPDIRLAESGAVAFWMNDEKGPLLYVDRKNSDRYGRQEFIEAMGLEMVPTERYDGTIARCDAIACHLVLKGLEIRVLQNPSEYDQDCDGADLVIIPKRQFGARASRLCGTLSIDADDLRRKGAHSLYLEAGKKPRIRTARRGFATRPWHR